jgi:hypothetical protein
MIIDALAGVLADVGAQDRKGRSDPHRIEPEVQPLG